MAGRQRTKKDSARTGGSQRLPQGGADRAREGGWEEWVGVIGLLVMLGVAVWSVEQARWLTPQPRLVLVLALGLATGVLLVKSRVPGIVALILATTVGIAVAVWQVAGLLPEPETAERMARLQRELVSWLRAASVGQPAPGILQVAMLFSLLIWFIGYLSVWFLLKRRNPWVAVLLGGTGLLINISNLIDPDYGYFFLFMLLALFLIAHTTLVRYYAPFRRLPGRYPRGGTRYYLVLALFLSALMLPLAWLTPEVRFYGLEDAARANTPLRKEFDRFWQDFFAAVHAKKPSLVHGGKGDLRFGGSLELSNQVLFTVSVERPRYWRTQTYDMYLPSGWVTTRANNEVLRQGSTRPRVAQPLMSKELTYTVVTHVFTDVLLGTGEVVSGTVPVVIDSLPAPVFTIRIPGFTREGLLPPDIAVVAAGLRTLGRRPATDSDIEQSLPGDLRLVSVRRSGEQVNEVRVARRQPQTVEETVALSVQRSLDPNQSYTLKSLVSTATPVELARAGTSYPSGVTDRYLQLPLSFPRKVRDLAESITRGADTPYAKATAIKDYLSNIPYSLIVEAPPAGADGVEYFLFTGRVGYCTYFASAMATMLRSVGVPTRFSAGYMPGLWDEESESYVVSDSDFHAWAEIYFPGYGWIEFEATPGRGLTGLDEDVGLGEDEGAEDDAGVDEEAGAAEAPGVSLPLVALGVVAAIVLLVLGAYRLLTRLVFTGLDTSAAAYGKMCFLASLVGLGPEQYQTPLEYSARLSAAFRQQGAAMGDITRIYVAAQYGRDKTLAASQRRRLNESWRVARGALLKRLFHVR